MKKIKYYYNTNSLRYEKLETPLRVRFLRVFAFLATALVTSAIISYFAFRFIGSPGEKILRKENEYLQDQYKELNTKISSIQQQLGELEKRDNEVYRAIFEATPIPDSARAKQLEKQKEIESVERMKNIDLVYSITNSLSNLNNRVIVQKKSYTEINELLKNKEDLLASTPAIQPVSNKDLTRIASGYGHRIDPIYKTIKMHAGLDFTAPLGTPIYATAKGVVKIAGSRESGYGNHIIINHGYGYESVYGHLFKVNVRSGQAVKRGEIIGFVGTSGKSTGPHLHYEVRKNGRKVDPIFFFYNDLTPEQFDQLLKRAAASNQSLD